MAHSDASEVELKFELGRRDARRLQGIDALAKADRLTRSQRTVYFDTPRGKLRRKGYSLRVRQDGDNFIQTVKTGGGAGLFDRGEWEAKVRRMATDTKALGKTPLANLKGLGKVVPTVRTQIKRRIWLVQRDGATVEVALDRGKVHADGHKTALRELEFELKSGPSDGLFDLAREIGRDVALEIGVLSKEEHGRMLADGELEREHRAQRIVLDPKMDAAQAFATIVHECVRQFRLNQAPLVDRRDAEGLHQARVAMRRLRAAFSLFKPAIRPASVEPLRDELRNFLEPFGEARNIDAYLHLHRDTLDRHDRRILRRARRRRYDEVIASLQAQRARDMMLDLIAWTESGDWREMAARDPAADFLSRRIDTLWRKVEERGADIVKLDETQLHKLRIAIKKLRYGIEFAQSLFAAKKVKRFTAVLEKMQDCLGLIHDDMVARGLAAKLGLHESGRSEVTVRARQLQRMRKRFDQLCSAGRFWTS